MSKAAAQVEPVFSIALDAAAVREASSWLATSGRELGVPQEQVMRLDLCLNECMANILSHGGPQARMSPVELTLLRHVVALECVVQLTIRDAGVEFDPSRERPRSQPKNLQDASPGGLGLLMIQSNCDAMVYRRVGMMNELCMSVHWQIGE